MTVPFPYQLEDVETIEKFDGRVLLALEMSLGKTFEALLYLQRHPKMRPAVVICRSSLKWNWEREAKHHIGMRAVVLEGTRPKKMPVRNDAPLYIVNYDILSPIERKVKGRIYRAPGWARWLRKLRPKLIIIDECQALASLTSQRTNTCRWLCHGPRQQKGEDEKNYYRVPHVLALSGTPVVNRPFELWPTLNILWPEKFIHPYAFGHRYCAPRRGFASRWEFKGASNKEKLRRRLLRAGMIRRTLEEVSSQLPAKRRVVLPLDIDDRQQYDKAVNNFAAWVIENHGIVKARLALYAEWMTKLGYLIRLAAKLKRRLVFEWIDDFLAKSNEKLIIFAVHHDMINGIKERYGNKAVRVDGSVTGRKRQLAFDAFVKGKPRLFIGQIKAAGEGWNAKGIRFTAFVEFPWAPGTVTQAEGRTRGHGRGVDGKRSVSYFLVAKDTIEETLVRTVQKKQKDLNAVLDGKGRGDSLNIFDMLTKELTGNP